VDSRQTDSMEYQVAAATYVKRMDPLLVAIEKSLDSLSISLHDLFILTGYANIAKCTLTNRNGRDMEGDFAATKDIWRLWYMDCII
jgi:hypothetical protein